jgi:argininosuccinate lyase
MSQKQAGPLWGGRFAETLHPALHEFTNSLPFDRRLVRHDLLGSLAHTRMLLEQNILSRGDAEAILAGLSNLLREIEAGDLVVEGEDEGDEDVHAWIERTLAGRIGEPAGRLHTARSRNDQTSVALRLFTREALSSLVGLTQDLATQWLAQAESHTESWLPGYTHLQRGQPVSLAHHLLAHVWALIADAHRLRQTHDEAGVSPLGAAALAGSSFPLDPARSAALLGFDEVFPNSILAVADRDYVAQAAFTAALLMVHLSRWADEIVLWTSSEFGFVRLSDAVSQGSSIMPQKKNPEAAELIRGKAGRAIGHVSGLLALMKGLPFAYNSDFQEDKEALFDALDTAGTSLAAAAIVADGLEYRTDRMREALHGGMLAATELADYLVHRGTPFRTAHEQVGHAVREAESRGGELADLPLDSIKSCCPDADDDVAQVLDPERAAEAHDSPGGPAPARVAEQLESARSALAELREWQEGREPPPIYVAHRDGQLLEESIP